MKLNQFIAHAGICARRKAVLLIKAKKVQVNGEPILDPAYEVAPTDRVSYRGQLLTVGEKVYILLNKPMNTLTTLYDPQQRRTVRDLLGRAIKSRIYPVGRLDRNTTGLLLLTNDGLLAHRLAHPAYEIPKVYSVQLATPLQKRAQKQIKKSVSLVDGPAKVDELSPLDRAGYQWRIRLHSGKNRIIRRIFAALGYKIIQLDRVQYAHLTKKNLALGAWRRLTAHECGLFKTLLGKRAERPSHRTFSRLGGDGST